jgi:hypothetical protein
VFTAKDGLPNDQIFAIQEDKAGCLWLNTGKGLVKFDPRTRKARGYNLYNGLKGRTFFFKSRDEQFYYVGINGINVFRPENIRDNPLAPPVVLTSFRIFDKPAPLKQEITATKEINLPYSDNFFSFEFAALDYTDPEFNQYAYRMEGFDQDWIYSGNRRYVSYTNLDPGTYTFRVKASNNDGIWNEKGTALQVIITPPFWQTWWFRISTFLIIAGGLYALHRYRMKQALEVERLRVRIAGDLHDDIGSSLTKISLYSELIQNGADAGESQVFLRKISMLSREIVQTMGDIVWSIDARNETLGDLIIRMKDFATSVLPTRNISLSFNVEGIQEDNKLSSILRQNLYLIFKEAINNIVKHANASTVEVSLRNTDGQYQLIIRDNGVGLRQHNGHNGGHGLQNMHRRAASINAQLSLLNQDGLKLVLNGKSL